MGLAKQLNFSEERNWKDRYRGHDRAQQLRTEEWLRHYFVQQAGHMDRHHLLYSRRKQSQYQRFVMEPEGTRWEDQESTSEYDTDIDDWVEKLTEELQVMVKSLHDLQAQQPSEKETAQLVQQVVLPVASGTPVPPMEVDGTSVATMGPGQPATDKNMPDIFVKPGEDEELEEE